MRTASRRRQLDLEGLCRLPTMLFASASPKGDRMAYLSDKTGRIELFVLDVATRKSRQLSDGQLPRVVKFPFAWADPDGRALVFGKDRDGDERAELFRIDAETGSTDQLTQGSNGWQVPIKGSPDGQWFSMISARAGQLNLWKMRPNGLDATQLTKFAAPTFGGEWSPDGAWLSVTSNEESDLENQDAYIVPSAGGEVQKVLSLKTGSKDRITDWHPDGKRVLVASDASGLWRLGIMDLRTKEVQWLTPDGIDEGSLGAKFSPSGGLIATLRTHESQLRPVVYDVGTGKARLVNVPDGVATGADFVDGESKLLISYATDTTRTSMVFYDLATDATETVVPADYGSIDPAVFVESKHVYYPSFDGKQVPAILFTPRDVAAGERLPALVHVHGGPTGQWFRGFDPFAQFLVDLGLVVIEPNVRGSTGYGVEWRDAAIKDWGGADLEDVAGAVKYLKSLPYVDPRRIVIFGGSYGGFMTFIAATKKPDLWRAAVAWVGITDLKLMYEDSNPFFRYFLNAQMGDPEKDAALWADRSAINFADKLSAKLLMVHGLNDPRCPVSQSRRFRDRLIELGRAQGEDFEYVEFADEGHGSNDIQQKIRTFKTVGDYLDKVL